MAVLALAQSTALVTAAVVTALAAIVGGMYANRVRRDVAAIDTTAKRTESLQTGQASLIEDLQREREAMQREIKTLRQEHVESRLEMAEHRSELRALKVQSKETEAALIRCREHEAALQERVVQLEGR